MDLLAYFPLFFHITALFLPITSSEPNVRPQRGHFFWDDSSSLEDEPTPAQLPDGSNSFIHSLDILRQAWDRTFAEWRQNRPPIESQLPEGITVANLYTDDEVSKLTFKQSVVTLDTQLGGQNNELFFLGTLSSQLSESTSEPETVVIMLYRGSTAILHGTLLTQQLQDDSIIYPVKELFYLANAYVTGVIISKPQCSLAALLEQEKSNHPRLYKYTVVFIMKYIAKAVAQIHEKGLSHPRLHKGAIFLRNEKPTLGVSDRVVNSPWVDGIGVSFEYGSHGKSLIK